MERMPVGPAGPGPFSLNRERRRFEAGSGVTLLQTLRTEHEDDH